MKLRYLFILFQNAPKKEHLKLRYLFILFQNTPKRIPLVASEIAETNIDEKSNAFRIRPSESKRVYYMHADDENTQHNWMQAICFAKAAGHTGDESQACTVQ